MNKLSIILFLTLTANLHAQNIVLEKNTANAFPIASANQMATILFDEKDDSLVHIAATLLQKDIEAVTNKLPGIVTTIPSIKNIIVIGSLEKSSFIQQLVAERKINIEKLKEKWEGYQIQTIKAPFKNVDNALVIVGSDRRGTAYGVFELSRQIGVSPWYWWADVPVKKKKEIYIKPNTFLSDAPKVKYRGIFINDEAPALSGWTNEKFGGMNHLFYEKVFELILRNKGNYLWPAMWGNAFNDDDKLNPVLADKWGIVMGTSHHEPMLRAQQEWKRFGKGAWDYTKNDTVLKDFWRTGIKNMGTHESIVTLAMRGDGDMPMTQGTATALLEKIVKDQRDIITEVTGKPAEQTPQLWALYKEVQDYYDKGMRVPDDVTLLLCDDNWGNIRKLPKLNEPKRKGGYGIYYHFDYVGGPRNYKWLNTNNLARVWEQMHLAWEYDAKQIWIGNVGDIKPMELPISFFLDYAWNPNRWNEDNLRTYYRDWASQQFGSANAKQIGEILRKYSQLSARRKPELLSADTYNSWNEWHRIINEWDDLLQEATNINNLLAEGNESAFYQLVLHPIDAMANLHKMYYNIALNKEAAVARYLSANHYADETKELYKKDSLITLKYHAINNSKWNWMMSQTHIGYTYWQQPPFNKMPDVKYIAEDSAKKVLIKDPTIRTNKDVIPKTEKGNLFYELNEYISIESEHWTKAINTNNIKWKVITDIGKTGSGITTFPVTLSSLLTATSPHVEYDFYNYDTGKSVINLYFSPTLNFLNTEEGLQFAVSIDNEKPQIISLNKEDKNTGAGIWNNWVANNIIVKKVESMITKPGKHTLKYWMISQAVVLQKIVIAFAELQPSYLGPAETKWK